MFYTGKILNFLDFDWEKRINYDIFGNNLRMEDILLICFEQIVIFFSTLMQTNSSCFVKSYNIFSLN